ncbi:MAG: HDOD domain-containing protein [Gammaproteobacteria bacterium]
MNPPQPNRELAELEFDPATATPFYLKCSNAIIKEKLQLPTIPDAAMKIRRAINDEKANNMKIARVVQTDPTITARLIQISNSAFYRRRKTIESCPEALTRLGLKVAQDLITSFSLKTVFKAKSRAIRNRMNELWQHSSYVAAICAVLAHKTPGFDPDRAMLAGLVHDIGSVPILTLADDFPELSDDPSPLDRAIEDFRGHVGALIMRKWNFPRDFEDIALHAEDWHRDHSRVPDYTDLVIVSQLHSFVGNIGIHRYPKMQTLPAYTKLVTGKLDADLSLNILEIAKEEIWEIQKLLIN